MRSECFISIAFAIQSLTNSSGCVTRELLDPRSGERWIEEETTE